MRFCPAHIRQVVGVSKLRTKYESHEARRILAGAYDLFVADERVIPSLPKLLGASSSPASVCCLACPCTQATHTCWRRAIEPTPCSVIGEHCVTAFQDPLLADSITTSHIWLLTSSAVLVVGLSAENMSSIYQMANMPVARLLQARRSSGRRSSRCRWTCAAATGAPRSSAPARRPTCTPRRAPASALGAVSPWLVLCFPPTDVHLHERFAVQASC